MRPGVISTVSNQAATLEIELPDTSVCEECEGEWCVCEESVWGSGVCGREWYVWESGM